MGNTFLIQFFPNKTKNFHKNISDLSFLRFTCCPPVLSDGHFQQDGRHFQLFRVLIFQAHIAESCVKYKKK